MSDEYQQLLANTYFVPNIVILIGGQYFSMRQTDSGLVVPDANVGMITDLTLNPSQVDPYRASTIISSVGFKLIDRNNVITSLFGVFSNYLQGMVVEIFIGRTGVGLNFLDYLKYPPTTIRQVSKVGSEYTFTCTEKKDALAGVAAFSSQSVLSGDILSGTTIITLGSIPPGFPSSGVVFIDKEFISYAGISGNNLTGCIRGLQGSVPATHSRATIVYLINAVSGNLIDILLQVLISPGGGGAYDVLTDGAGFDQNTVDIAEFQRVRNTFFPSLNVSFNIYNISTLLQFIEDEFLFPFGLRLKTNNNSKVGIGVLNRELLNIDAPNIDESNTLQNPNWNAYTDKIVNYIRISWDWDDIAQGFTQIQEFIDQNSINKFGISQVFEVKTSGVKASMNGQAIVNSIRNRFLKRFAFPLPEIDVSTNMTASSLVMTDKTEFISKRVVNNLGGVNFDDTLEVLSKAVNWKTGQVKYKLAFTTATGLRSCFIAPSDPVITLIDSFSFNLGTQSDQLVDQDGNVLVDQNGNPLFSQDDDNPSIAGAGAHWRKGWKVRLRYISTKVLVSNQINTITLVDDDIIHFQDAWAIAPTTDMMLIFARYSDVVAQQQKFCFINCNLMFPDLKKFYSIVCDQG